MAEQLHDYVRGSPHPALAGLVLDYSGYREHSVAPLRRRQAPTGTCTLILSLDPPIRLFGPSERQRASRSEDVRHGPSERQRASPSEDVRHGPSERQRASPSEDVRQSPAGSVVRRSFLAGMHDRAVVTEYVGAQAGVQVDLTPLGVHVLLGHPMPELTNQVPALDEVGVPALAALPGRLGDAAGWRERFAHVDDVLLRLREASRTPPSPEVAWAWRQLVRSDGRRSVAGLADAVGWSRRRLLTRFEAQVGLGPKAAARVLRFRHAADLLTAPGRATTTITDVAAAAGYADHSHLVREFRALAGCTPTQYARAELTDPGYPFVQAPPGAGVLPSAS